MAEERIRVEGDQRLAATLARAAVDVADMSDPGTRSANLIRTRAGAVVPVRRGRLRSTLGTVVDRQRAEITAGTEYANRTHWGYRRYHQAPQRFITDPTYQLQPTWLGYYRAELGQVLSQVKGA